VQIRNVPKKLLEEFDEVVVKPLFPGGRAEAVRDLMRRAIQEQRLKGA
jgi:metal-responsive CopG/Arc/MetJ family transcriptional regulator